MLYLFICCLYVVFLVAGSAHKAPGAGLRILVKSADDLAGGAAKKKCKHLIV